MSQECNVIVKSVARQLRAGTDFAILSIHAPPRAIQNFKC